LRRLLVIPLLLLTVLTIPPGVSPVRAQQGVVCLATSDMTDCSSAPASFSGSSSVTVAVNIDGSDAFNGIDISIQTDPNLLRPISNDLTGSLLGSNPFVLASTDDPLLGAARVAAFTFQPTTAPSTGRLFAVNYKVVGNTFDAPIGFTQGCNGTSVPGFCVTVAFGSTPLDESIVGGTFTGAPDFTVIADPQETTTGAGSVITVRSLNGFQGVASISAEVLPMVNNGPTVSFNVTTLEILPFNTNASKLSFIVTDLTPAQNYTARVTATLNDVSHSVDVFALFQRLSVSTAFTHAGSPFPSPIPLDDNGNPRVNVVLANSVVTSTNPGEVDVYTNASNTGVLQYRSIQITETLPVDWVVTPPLNQSQGGAHVYFMYSDGTIRDITPKTGLSVSNTNPEVVSVALPDIRNTRALKFLDPGEKIVLQVKLSYAPKGTIQHARNFPIVETVVVQVTGFTEQLLRGFQSDITQLPFFTAYAKVVGDVNGDFKVDILDVALVAYSFGTKKNQARWNAAADINSDGVIDILDVALSAYYFGTSDW